MPAPFFIALPLVIIESTSSCPTTPQIQMELAALSAEEHSKAERDRVRVTERGDRLFIQLFSDSGAVLAEKELDAEDDCEVLARAVAVTVATWTTVFQERREAAVRRDEPLDQPAEAIAPRGQSSADDMGQARDEPRPEGGEEPEFELPADSEENPAFGVELSGAFGVAVDERDSSVSGLLAAAIRWDQWGAQLALRHESSRDFALEGGRVSYSRPAAVLSASWQTSPNWITAEAGLGLGMAWVRVEGAGFSTNTVASDMELSAEAYLRAYFFRGPVRPFLQGAASVWPAPQVAVVQAAAGPVRSVLPAWVGQFAIGIAAFL